jgi:hypothetical protein
LQISDGACPAARAALEEFLAVRSTCLLDEKYAEVVELYVIKVLVKGFQETESAMDWVERANLPEERRLVSLSVCPSSATVVLFYILPGRMLKFV